MTTEIAKKLEFILSGTGTSKEEFNEIIDLMEEYKQLNIHSVSVSFKSLLEEASGLYEQAKKAPNEREELILASKSIMCREIAYRLLNER